MVVMLAAVIPAGGVTGSGKDDFFAETGTANVVIRAPLGELHRDPGKAVPFPGTIEIDRGPRVPVTFEAYGLSRLRECEFPPMHIRLAEGAPSTRQLDGRCALRLVTPCSRHGASDRHAVLEYLVYAGYKMLAEPALGVRLARVRLVDTAEEHERAEGYGFFVEDIRDVAARHGLQWRDTPPASLAELDAAQLTLMTLYQFMVGNTDWSAVRGPRSEPCCHNVAFLVGAQGPGLVLPFDFDQSGLVGAPYAFPSPELGIRDVRQRVFRGFCEHNGLLPSAIAVLNRRRPDLEALFNSPDLPYPKDRRRALRYIEEFYEIVNEPEKLQKQIVSQCR
jgi:hypothetical protein